MISPMTMKGGFAASVVLAGISMIHAIGGWSHTQPQPGTVLASALTQSVRPETVLLDSSVPVTFVDSLRRADADRHFVMLGNASSETQSGSQAADAKALAASMNQAREAVMQEGAKYVVVSDGAAHTTLESSLRALLRSDARFKLLGTFPVSNASDLQTSNVYLYENLGNAPGAIQYVPVRIAQVK
jgi:hypothetical protein